MYIPNTLPATLAEMLAFLQPTVGDGLFDSVAYDNESSPTKIVCTQNGNTILDISVSDAKWNFLPYAADGITGNGITGMRYMTAAYRCKGGVLIAGNNGAGDATFTRWNFLIAKTSAGGGKTGFVRVGTSGYNAPQVYVNGGRTFHTTCFGDSTSAQLFTGGFSVYIHYTAGTPYDRTILTKLPVVGEPGSTDYFTTAAVRNCVQFYEDGEQIIGGKQYGCAQAFAILDE